MAKKGQADTVYKIVVGVSDQSWESGADEAPLPRDRSHTEYRVPR
jgi:hypothetical protein